MSNGTGAMPEHRPRTPAARRVPRLLHVLAAVLTACLVALGTASAAQAAPGDDVVKVFVVPDPAQTGGQSPTLESVAASTLGDPARANEIFQLNRGQRQQDGTALNNPGDQLRPGWILRLPEDASGPDVRTAVDTSQQGGATAPPAAGTQSAPATTGGQTTMFTIPLPAAIAVLGAVLLALVTAGIVGRRKVRAGFAAVLRLVHRLGAPARRRRRLMARRATGRRFATDADSVRRAYEVLGEFGPTRQRAEKPVHAVRVDGTGVTVWLGGAEGVEAPWANVAGDDGTAGPRWRRPAAAVGWLDRGEENGRTSQAPVLSACLVRAGTDADGEPVFVDLSRLDGVLSVTGDRAVARDVVENLLAEVARSRPNTPVTVLRGADDLPVTLPSGLNEMARVDASAPAERPGRGIVRAAAARRPVAGLVVLTSPPTERESAELAALCGPGGAGWTGLVCGEVDGAHWRWRTDAEGHVDVPVLDLRLTVPA
ncbi:hypothetical protein AB0F77_04780 [Streptomyces sp. NPDC026672]|uniref:hypothetical protein n=1 Tax=unclassified Streptomyces TaxID=2593676 RepID=UPI0033E11B87